MAFASTSNLNKTLLNNETLTSNLNTSQSINDNNNNQLKIASNNIAREDDEWIAVKSLDTTNSINNNIQHNIVNLANNEIINIVSISVEKEKIAIVTREHNRLVTDDENTKQWYGVYTMEQLYLINQRMCELDPNLDEFYPKQLRPIKGILSTYFTDKLNSLDTTEDLQDNQLCNAFSLYLNKAFQSLGKRLYIDILFDDVNSDQYFEIYSEFNLKRIRNQIEKLKQQLFPISITNMSSSSSSKQSSQHQAKLNNSKLNNSFSLNELIKKQNEEYELQHKLLLKQQIFSNLKHVLNSYSNEDNQIELLINLYAEYYGNLLQPLTDSLEIAKNNLNKYTTKLINQEKSSKLFTTQSTANALVDLKNNVDFNKSEIIQLSTNIDSINIEYKQNLIDLYTKLLNKLKLDRDKFIQTSLNLDLSSLFDILTKNRKEKLNDHIAELKIQTYNLQLSLLEKKKEDENKNTISKLNDINKQIINLKLQLYSEEEIVLKRKLNKLNEDESVIELKEKQLKNLLNEPTSDYTDFKIEEIKEIISKIDLNNFVNKEEEFDYDLTCDSEDDESDFHDTYDDPLVLMQVEAKEKQAKQNEINAIKKKITEIGSKKSALRINLSKLNEAEKVKLENEAEKMNETDKLNQTNVSIKSFALKKQEDEIQSKENLENRRKALQRIREHKSKHMKDSMFSSNDSIASVNTTSAIKKPYVPKSKQRILPPPPKPRLSKPIEFKNSITFEVKLNNLDEITKLDDEIKSSNLINIQPNENMLSESEIFNFKPSISSSVNINNETMASSSVPPPPPLPLFMTSSTNNSALPISNLPPPPPPPPLPPSFLSSSTTDKLPIQNIPPAPLLFSSETFKNELKLAKTTPKSTKNNQLKPIDNSSKHNRSFDINEIKTFKFKPVKVNVKERPSIDSQNKNPWDNLMNEIRSNGGNKLKKVSDSSTSKSSKQMKFNNDDNLVRDLNQILSQRSQFFKDDDDNESSDDESWSGFINS